MVDKQVVTNGADIDQQGQNVCYSDIKMVLNRKLFLVMLTPIHITGNPHYELHPLQVVAIV